MQDHYQRIQLLTGYLEKQELIGMCNAVAVCSRDPPHHGNHACRNTCCMFLEHAVGIRSMFATNTIPPLPPPRGMYKQHYKTKQTR